MTRDLFLAGLVGLVLGVVTFGIAGVLSTRLSIFLQHWFLTATTFGFFLVLSVVEIPLMIFGLRLMARNATMPRRLLIGAFTFYVMFASVYASIFVVLTGQIGWGIALAALCVVRFVSGFFVR